MRNFILIFENVITHGKEDEERDIEIKCHLEEAVSDFYYEIFERDGSVTDEAKRYQVLRRELIDRFSKIKYKNLKTQ